MHHLRCLRCLRMGRQQQVYRVFLEMGRHRHSLRRIDQSRKLLARSHLCCPLCLYAHRGINNLQQITCVRETHHDLEQEAIKLRLWQSISALHLQRVLRGQHKEGFWQGACRSEEHTSELQSPCNL